MKSAISIIMILAMLLSFVACSGGSQGQTNDTTKPTDSTTEPAYTEPVIEYEDDELPSDLDLGGQTIKFIYSSFDDKATELFTEELNSDVINDSIYNRERSVEERLHVEIEPVPVTFGEIGEEIEKMWAADDDMYQLCAHATSDFTDFVFKDYFTDLTSLNYIDLEKPWWSQTFNDEAEIMDKLYIATGSLSLSLTRYLFAVFYNKTVADNYSDKYSELNELYDMVDRGEWTYDKFYELGSSIYTDNNGDTLKDEEDSYGIGFQSMYGADVLWSSFDINILSPDGEGWFELNVPVEKMYDAFDKLHILLFDTTGCYNAGTSDSALDTLSAMFASDNLLFMSNQLVAIESATLRNMPSDYGILPFPKYDAKQENYYSYSHDWYTTFAIPKTNTNPDAAAAVLEALASYAYRDTEPAYLNTALKGKYMSDAQSRKMLDLVVDGFMVDASWIYYKTIGRNFPTNFRPESDKTNYSSTYQKSSRSTQMLLKGYKMESSFS